MLAVSSRSSVSCSVHHGREEEASSRHEVVLRRPLSRLSPQSGRSLSSNRAGEERRFPVWDSSPSRSRSSFSPPPPHSSRLSIFFLPLVPFVPLFSHPSFTLFLSIVRPSPLPFSFSSPSVFSLLFSFTATWTAAWRGRRLRPRRALPFSLRRFASPKSTRRLRT